MNEPQPGTAQQPGPLPSDLQENVAFVLGRAPSFPPAPDFVSGAQGFVGGGNASLGAMAPVGCGFFVTSPDHPIKEGNMKWSQTKAPAPVEDAWLLLSDRKPLEAVGALKARVHWYADFADTTAITGYIDWDVTGFTADLSKEEVLVVFEFPTRVNT